MELWIRSQSKKTLTKVNEIYISETEIKANYKAYYSGCESRKLGEYKTEERALEVLDEIQDLMRSVCDCDLKIILYEMPKE